MKKLAICIFLVATGFALGTEMNSTHVHGDALDNGRYSLFRTDADTNFYDRGVFFLDSASGTVYRYDWEKKAMIEVPKIKP